VDEKQTHARVVRELNIAPPRIPLGMTKGVKHTVARSRS
jgi:hypothetical protein